MSVGAATTAKQGRLDRYECAMPALNRKPRNEKNRQACACWLGRRKACSHTLFSELTGQQCDAGAWHTGGSPRICGEKSGLNQYIFPAPVLYHKDWRPPTLWPAVFVPLARPASSKAEEALAEPIGIDTCMLSRKTPGKTYTARARQLNASLL